MSRAICDECGAEGIPDVFWIDPETGDEMTNIPRNTDPSEYPPLEKHVARECPECQNYWEYVVE